MRPPRLRRAASRLIQRGRTAPLLALTVVLVVAGVPLAAADGGPARGELSAPAPLLTGSVTGAGPGELRIDGAAGRGLTADAAAFTIERHWMERVVVQNPTGGGPISLTAGGMEKETISHGAGTLIIDDASHDLRILVIARGADNEVAVTDSLLDAWPLLAFQNAGILLDESGPVPQHRPDDDQVFTYVAGGVRFPIEASALAASGQLTLYVWGAEYRILSEHGTAGYQTGERAEGADTHVERRVIEYHLIRLDTASLTAGAGIAWIEDPTLLLAGSLEASTTTGWLDVAGAHYDLDAMPLAAEGTLEITPFGRGTARAIDIDAFHLGTSATSDGIYPETVLRLNGDVHSLSLAGNALVGATDLRAAAAAAAGLTIIGAVALGLTPQGKWLLLGAVAPLYAKTEKHRLLENPHRERLYDAIRANPGVNLSALHRLTEQGWGATVHHLKLMERRNLILSVRRGHERNFFVHDTTSAAARLRMAIAALATKESPQRVARAIIAVPGQSQSEVAMHTGLSTRMVSHHAARLVRLGLLESRREGQHVRYWPTSDLELALDAVAPETHSVDTQTIMSEAVSASA